MLHSTSIRVRYAESDQMGVVYHANYLIWCDIGRTEFIRSLGGSYLELERQGLYLAVSEAGIRLAAPARYDDLVRVLCWLSRVQSRAVTFAYHISRVKPGPECFLASATTKLIATNSQGTAQSLPPEIVNLFRGALRDDVHNGAINQLLQQALTAARRD